MHRLLRRQLRKHLGIENDVPDALKPFVAAVERGETRDDVAGWLRETTHEFFAGVPTRSVRFLGSITCLRPLP